eukprot:TRINITY_DN6836_c0_g1_i3.p1 TRINITY_DN6836_c0_g1~~TRINITY_DN6836_c0_g1_i3.p1  ORF type:complete len:250 (+),score=11.50 TRINITY_DN6836_c0_g1_i3:90-839(+)
MTKMLSANSPSPPASSEELAIFMLPSDVFLQLIRLFDVDDVLRCCCVCKAYNAGLSLDTLKKLFYDPEFDLPEDRKFTKQYLRTIARFFRKLPSITKPKDVAAHLTFAIDWWQPRFAIRALNEAVKRGLQGRIPFQFDRLFVLGSVELAKRTLEVFSFSSHHVLRDTLSFVDGNIPIMHLVLDSVSPETLGRDRLVFARIAAIGNAELFLRTLEICSSHSQRMSSKRDYAVIHSHEKTPIELFRLLFND